MFRRTQKGAAPRVASRAVKAAGLGGAAVLLLSLTACSAGGGGGSSDGPVTITFLTDNAPASSTSGQALIKAFEKDNPKITVKLDSRPQGTDGDNLIKTRLSTGEMADVFTYNSGSLFQALHPDNTLADLSDQSWVKDLTPEFKTTVSTSKATYGAPFGTSFGGAVMYNKAVYKKLGLDVPQDWATFMSNSDKIKAAGITPIIQTYGDTWTSQLFVLGDFANVTSQQEDWASQYTKNKERYVDQPAFASFQHQQEVYDKGYLNKDFASATQVAGLKMLATGEGAQYPMLTNAIATIQQNNPDDVNDIGVFALPAQNASDTKMTIWEPGGAYIPKTTEGGKLAAAKKFVAFMNSSAGCEIQNTTIAPSGPYATSACTLPSDVAPVITDLQKYVDDKKVALALEFLSPIKGPNLEKITVQVGSGISSAATGAKLYDADVKQQAQQLGEPGW
ncbi:raffinose/stachyose/melibiose transport system substrate-binding protein [Frondihabitans sp. PhB188]|uniref:ABC transporter substrate-binding protein n=1 Tax=Frondihabitans sp. PhB188 TaxID=2485200 RepID=UPI000F4A2346|nr:extracellular solute-binding protein [Frondihabitans sp. PhB188]ROQ39753.1 raffinose/stachyose/melibiose transport system substrate-binding protein [Frondihabitans sp. PhB188]